MKLAIVGSSKLDSRQQAVAQGVIEAFLIAFRPDRIVSGGAKGIDTIAADMAHDRGIPLTVFFPEKPKWKYYKKRNILIAEECDSMLVLRSEKSKTYGSGWTADYTEKLGKRVFKFLI